MSDDQQLTDYGRERTVTSHEAEILRVLLHAEFPGREALLTQLSAARVVPLDEDGSLRFHVEGSSRAEVVRRIPVEAEVDDADGTIVHLLVHVVDGFLNELEIFREDSNPVQREISPGSLRLLVL